MTDPPYLLRDVGAETDGIGVTPVQELALVFEHHQMRDDFRSDCAVYALDTQTTPAAVWGWIRAPQNDQDVAIFTRHGVFSMGWCGVWVRAHHAQMLAGHRPSSRAIPAALAHRLFISEGSGCNGRGR
jgi:hypothetical protein